MTHNSNPLVSVILPTYNAGEYLQAALESVIAQTYPNWELIIVDDGSTDGSTERAQSIIRDPRIMWLHQNNAGKSIAMNVALARASGTFYAIQDADDISHPRRLELLVHALLTNPDVAAVYSGHDIIFRGRHLAPTSRAKSPRECKRDIDRMAMPAHDPTGMYRLSMVRDIPYEPSLRVGQGYDYILRVGERFPMLVIAECLYSYRIHERSNTRRTPQRREDLVLEVLKRACQRRGKSFEEWRASQPRRRFTSPVSRLDNNLASHFIQSVHDQRQRNNRIGAIRTGLQCAQLRPTDPHYLKALAYALMPDWLRTRISSYA